MAELESGQDGAAPYPDQAGDTVDEVHRELTVPAPPEQVWKVVTGPGWLADEVELELVPGGDARFHSGATTRTGWVEDATAPLSGGDGAGRLVFWWSLEDEAATRVEVTLEPVAPRSASDGRRTRVRVVETRPLEALHLVGIALPERGGSAPGPSLLALA